MDPRAVLSATRGTGASLEARPDHLLPGRALQVLLASSASDIAAAFSPLAAVSQLLARRALDSLLFHSEKRPAALHDEILRPLLDQLVRHRVSSERAPTMRVCGALMREPSLRPAVLASLGQFLEGEERGLALGAVLFLEQEMKATERSESKDGEGKGNVTMWDLDEKHGAANSGLVEELGSGDSAANSVTTSRLTELAALAPALSRCASLAQPTRLACAAADLLIQLSHRCAALSLSSVLSSLLSPIDQYMQAAEKWHTTDRPMLAASLPSVRRLVALLSEHFKSNSTSVSATSTRLSAALCSEWAVLSPFIILNPSPSARREVRAALPSIAAQSVPQSKPDEATFRALLSLALAIGRLSNQGRDEAMRAILPSVLQASLAHASGPPESRGVAVSLLRCAAGQVEDCNMLIQPLLNMLSETDGVSEAVVAFLSEFSLRNLSAVLTPLFGMLQRGESVQRSNALGVLARIIAERPVGDEDLAEKLVTALCSRLSDTELQVRCATAPLFASLKPARSIPLLLTLLTNADERLRSAAQEALREVLCGQVDKQETLRILLASLEAEKEASIGERAARALANTAETMPTEKQLQLCNALLALSVQHPSSPVLVKLFAAAAPSLVAHHRTLLLSSLTLRMKSQQQLSEEMLNREGEEAAQAVRSLLFARLAPLLLLRAIPSTALLQSDTNEAIPLLDELKSRTSRLYEFEEVRRLAAELCAYLPYAGEALFSVLKEAHLNGHSHIARAALFGLCVCISLPNAAIDSLCTSLIGFLFSIISKPPPPDADEAKLRAGVTDCLATLARVSLQRLPARYSFVSPIQEIEEQQLKKEKTQGPEVGVAAVLPQILRSIAEELRTNPPARTAPPIGARLATASVLVALCRLASPEEVSRLLSLSLSLLSRVAANQATPVQIRAAMLQALFAAVFSLAARSSVYSSPLLDLSLSLLASPDAPLRLGALKLLGAALPHAEEALRSNGGLILQIRNALVSLASMDSSTEVQQLATKLLELSGFAN